MPKTINVKMAHGKTVRMREEKATLADERYAEAHCAEIVAVARRGEGRPSLSGKGESPTIRVRLARGQYELVMKRAKAQGLSISAYARQRLTQAG
jgi:hypothetical protein